MRPPWETQGSSHKLHLQDEGRPLENGHQGLKNSLTTRHENEFGLANLMQSKKIFQPPAKSKKICHSSVYSRLLHCDLPKSYGLVSRNSEVSYFKSVTSSQTESRRKSVSTQHVDILFVSEISGWHIKFKNSSSSRVLYSSAADFWEKKCPTLCRGS